MTIRRSDIAFFFVLGLILYVAWLVRDVVLLLYISALFAVVINPAISVVRRLHLGKWHPGRGLAIAIILVGGATVMALFLVFALPPIFRDLQAASSNWPHRAVQVVARLQRLPFVRSFNPDTLQSSLERTIGGVLGLFRGIAGGLFWFFSWLILTLYFIIDGERAFTWIMSMFPPVSRSRLEAALLRAEARVSKWLVGQAGLMLILGCCSAVVYGLLRVKYFYALAVFAGAANIVPIIGPLTSVAVAAIVAGLDSWSKLVGVLVFYFLYQQIESAFLTPRIMKSTLDLPPLAVIIALSLGGALAGVLGALVAVPTAALVAVLAEEYLVRPNRAAESSELAANQNG